MISPRFNTRTITYREWRIPAPATWKDVSDVIFQIKESEGWRYDDQVMVVNGDDEIIFRMQVDEEVVG